MTTDKLSLKILAARIDELSSRLESLENSAPSPSLSPVCHVCGKPGKLQAAPFPTGGKLSPRVMRPAHKECI